MSTRAKDIMTTELILGHPNMTVGDAIKSLVNNRITGMPVVDQNRQLVGVISEYDIIKKIEQENIEKPIKLDAVIDYSQKVTTIEENTSLQEILKLFIEKKVRRLPVLNEKKQLMGIISRRDIMRVFFYRSKEL